MQYFNKYFFYFTLFFCVCNLSGKANHGGGGGSHGGGGSRGGGGSHSGGVTGGRGGSHYTSSNSGNCSKSRISFNFGTHCSYVGDPGFYGPANNSNNYYNETEETVYWFDLAEEAKQNEDYQEAVTDYSKVIELDSNYVEAYNYRALAEYALHKYYQAIIDFGEVLKLDPYNAEAYYCRALILEECNLLDEAIKDFETAINLCPHNKKYKRNLQAAKQQADADANSQ